MPLAAGATCPKRCMWAITSWRNRFSYSAAFARSISSSPLRISSSACCGIGSPNSCCAAARARRPENLGVHFSRVRLACNAVSLSEPHAVGHGLVQRIHLFVISLEQVEERGLCPGRTLYTPETERLQAKLEFSMSRRRSCNQRVARLPTVVGWAG